MGSKLKYKKGDVIVNGKGKHLGIIVKVEKYGQTDKTNKYEIEKSDGTRLALDEHQIIESSWHKKNKD